MFSHPYDPHPPGGVSSYSVAHPGSRIVGGPPNHLGYNNFAQNPGGSHQHGHGNNADVIYHPQPQMTLVAATPVPVPNLNQLNNLAAMQYMQHISAQQQHQQLLYQQQMYMQMQAAQPQIAPFQPQSLRQVSQPWQTNPRVTALQNNIASRMNVPAEIHKQAQQQNSASYDYQSAETLDDSVAILQSNEVLHHQKDASTTANAEEKQRVSKLEEDDTWADYDTHIAHLQVMLGAEIKACILTIRANPLKGFATIQLVDSEEMLGSFKLGTAEFNVTVAENKLALHVNGAGATGHTGPTAVLLVASSMAEAKTIANALCVGVFGNRPVIRGEKEAAAKEREERKKASEEKIRNAGFMKPLKKQYDVNGIPHAPLPIGQKGKSAVDARYDANGRFNYKGPPTVSKKAHPPSDTATKPVRRSPRAGSIISQTDSTNTNLDDGEAKSSDPYQLSEDDDYGRSYASSGQHRSSNSVGNETETEFGDENTVSTKPERRNKRRRQSRETSDISDDDTALSADTESREARKAKAALKAEQKKEQQAKFRERDEAIIKQKQEQWKRKRVQEEESKVKQEYQKDLYKLNRDMIVMRARARQNHTKQNVREALQQKKGAEDVNGINKENKQNEVAKSESPTTSTGLGAAGQKPPSIAIASALSVISTITAKPSDISDFNYNSRLNSLIPHNSPETQRRLDARREMKSIRKQEADFERRIEKIRDAQKNKMQRQEFEREFEMHKLVDREMKMDEIMKREEEQFFYANKLLENKNAAKITEMQKKKEQQELNRQMSSLIPIGADGRPNLNRVGSTFSSIAGLRPAASGLSIGMHQYVHGNHYQSQQKFNVKANSEIYESLHQGHGSRRYNTQNGGDGNPRREALSTDLVPGSQTEENTFENRDSESNKEGLPSPDKSVIKKPVNSFHVKFKQYLLRLHIAQGGTVATFSKLHPRGIPRPNTNKNQSNNSKRTGKTSDVQRGYLTFAAIFLQKIVRQQQAQRRVSMLRRDIYAATIQYWYRSIMARRRLLWLEEKSHFLAKRQEASQVIGKAIFRYIQSCRKYKRILEMKNAQSAIVANNTKTSATYSTHPSPNTNANTQQQTQHLEISASNFMLMSKVLVQMDVSQPSPAIQSTPVVSTAPTRVPSHQNLLSAIVGIQSNTVARDESLGLHDDASTLTQQTYELKEMSREDKPQLESERKAELSVSLLSGEPSVVRPAIGNASSATNADESKTVSIEKNKSICCNIM